jgi:hypothetical protein
MTEHAAEIARQILAARNTAQAPPATFDEEEFRRDAEASIKKLAAQLTSGQPQLTPEMLEWSREHGRLRHQQGYSAAMLVEENRIFCAAVLDCIHNNLLIADVSQLIPDLKLLSATLSLMLREAIAAHEAEGCSGKRKPAIETSLRKSG